MEMNTTKTGTDKDGLSLDQFLCFAIYSTGHAFNQFYRPLLEELGLTYPQYVAMVSLWSKDDQTVKALGQALFLESNTLTPLLKRLEGMGLVNRMRDPVDERQVRVRLTEEGRALRERATRVPACVAEALGMPVEQIQALTDHVGEIRNRLFLQAAAADTPDE
jgi:DNA-binding MarR family transcriptional regulator